MTIDQQAVSRRITATLFIAQSLSSAAIILVATVLTIVAADLGGGAAKAGIPNMVTSLSAAAAAFIWGVLWDKIGRRKGLTLGLGLGFIGMLVSLVGVQQGLFGVLLGGMIGSGFSRSAMGLGRFIAAEVSMPERRGRAIATVVLGGTVGAILGPLLVAPSGQLALSLGYEELVGPFIIGAVLFFLVTIVTYIGLNPEPAEIAKLLDAEGEKSSGKNKPARPLSELLRQPPVIVAAVAMVVAQVVMALLMGIASLHMRDNSHGLNSISVVFSAHTLGMFAFSVLTGKLVDRWGRGPVIISGTLILIASAIVSPLSTSVLNIGVGMFLVGLGWNFCFVGGSTLLSDQLSPSERSSTQGVNDVFIALARGTAGYSAGVLYAGPGYATINVVAGSFVILPLALTIWWLIGTNQKKALAGAG